LTDGRDLLIYADRDLEDALHVGALIPPYERFALGDDDLVIDFGVRGTKSRKGVIVSSVPLTPRAVDDGTEPPTITWQPVQPGHMLVVRQGAVIADLAPPSGGPMKGPNEAPSLVSAAVASRQALLQRERAQPRLFEVRHRTIYRYAKQVERSTHLLRLTPRVDRNQRVRKHSLSISVPCQTKDFEDVFGNRARRLHIDTPWTEMMIEAKSLVEVTDLDPLDFRSLKSRSTIPLVWMPWQRQIMAPYLLPPELAESELDELTEYAMSFVKRNDYDLLDTLLDINQTIFKEYAYRQNSTTVFTTAFEVYANRRGVCQDFTNLFICLARLLGVPARYVCGYIYTGPKGQAGVNTLQSEASHAWVQLYLPEVGWRGFDPTNGILTQTDHVRVAVGRNYRDATPTSGTIYVGGGPETLEVDVRMEPAPVDIREAGEDDTQQ
jgi:transglutaminase-like putative cysteine protease